MPTRPGNHDLEAPEIRKSQTDDTLRSLSKDLAESSQHGNRLASAPSEVPIRQRPDADANPVRSISDPTMRSQALDMFGNIVQSNVLSYQWNKLDMPLAQQGVMQYDSSKLATWNVFLSYLGTVFNNSLLWRTLGRLLLTSGGVALIVFCINPDPSGKMSTAFMKMADATKVFLSLLLSFFLTSSVVRWGDAVAGFFEIVNAIRNLNMQMHALGVAAEHIEQISRYGVLSLEFLVCELKLLIKHDYEVRDAEMGHARELLVQRKRLTWPEAETLAKVEHPSGVLWVWVASYLGRLAQDKMIPPMASPTYGRIMNLAQNAEEGIRKVKIATGVQMPKVYVHTLAMLVHVNNMLCGISLGFIIGSRMGNLMSRMGFYHGLLEGFNDFLHWEEKLLDGELWNSAWNATAGHNSTPSMGRGEFKVMKEAVGMATTDWRLVFAEGETMMIVTFTNLVIPMLYQAFLQIGLLLSQPFDSPSIGVSTIPVDNIIQKMERDLDDMKYMATKIPDWKAPKFAS